MLLVGRARTGDRNAFAELVIRRQVWMRNLMRRCCGDAVLADDLAQQVFLTAWRTIPQLQRPSRFAAWLKRIAVNVWLQHARKNDPLKAANEYELTTQPSRDATSIGLDLDRSLAALSEKERLCIVLSYHERMTHAEISEFAGLPVGTVKSHIRRGTQRLQQLLSAYLDSAPVEEPNDN